MNLSIGQSFLLEKRACCPGWQFLAGGPLNRADFHGAMLIGADLTDAKREGATLINPDL
ncbi:pentapeptide repeat-containing protein [uncultured Roseobacter sp.]|uniref:pentapeptide repeat-containing protein n=1 Tax=uncultured Roseobacter sp. TaxID=114847 RepID=UPI00344F2559